MDAVTISLVLAVGLPFIGGNDKQAGPPCAWSSVWPQLNTRRYSAPPMGAEVVPPADKAEIRRLPSDVKRKVKGDWKLDLVIDQTGQVRDVKVVEAPKIEPAWPEYEAHVLATAKTWKHGAATVDGQPWPTCVTVTVKDH